MSQAYQTLCAIASHASWFDDRTLCVNRAGNPACISTFQHKPAIVHRVVVQGRQGLEWFRRV